MTDTPESVLKALDALVVCRRCRCPSCERAGTDELHDHVCTNSVGCVEKRHQMRAFRRNATRAARRAAALIREMLRTKEWIDSDEMLRAKRWIDSEREPQGEQGDEEDGERRAE